MILLFNLLFYNLTSDLLKFFIHHLECHSLFLSFSIFDNDGGMDTLVQLRKLGGPLRRSNGSKYAKMPSVMAYAAHTEMFWYAKKIRSYKEWFTQKRKDGAGSVEETSLEHGRSGKECVYSLLAMTYPYSRPSNLKSSGM